MIDPGASDPLLLLPGAVAATVAFQVVMVAGFFLQFELVHRSGRAFLASIHRMIGFTSALNCFGLALVLPYRDHPSVAVGLLAAFQGATFVVAKLSTSESLAVRRTAYLSETFSRYVPDSVARKLAEEGTAIQLGGEERDITVLFCDVRGFTAWSETVPAEQVVGELNVLLGELSHAVMEHGGTLDKFTGDGLMAFWGAPLDQPDHAALACDAAHDMAVRLDRVNAVRAGVGQPPFAIGIGINSGPAVVGNVGSEQRLDYTAIGDTVNLAARLEATTKDLGSTVVCSTSTRDHLPADRQPEFASLGFVRVKGKREPVAVHALATVHAPVDVPAA